MELIFKLGDLVQELQHIQCTEHCPSDFTASYASNYFNEERYLNLHGPHRDFYLLDVSRRVVLAHCAFHIKDKKAYSPIKGTFGGVDFDPSVSSLVLRVFLEYLEAALYKSGVNQIQMECPPILHDLKTQSKFEQLLIETGYCITFLKPNSTIPISSKPFAELVSKNEQKKLRKAIDHSCREVSRENFEAIYDFIEKVRQSKPFDLTMSKEALLKTINTLPEYFHFFLAEESGNISAAAICIRIRPQILYLFYGDHDPKYNKESPLVKLTEFIYTFCQKNRFKQLDLGTSHLANGGINQSLLHFKTHLGAKTSTQSTFIKTLG